AAEVADAAALCDLHIAATEREAGLPAGLLRSIALAESGRWLADRRESRPWPWTVTSGPEEHYYLPSRTAALDKVRELRARGRRNIDVGCMQVNLHYHGDAFPSPEAAVDPARNVAYAAGFLGRLRDETRSWGLAVARYHTSEAARGRDYRDRVFRLWRDERVRLAKLRRAGRPAAVGRAASDGRGPWLWLRGANAAVPGPGSVAVP
ncbi:MAG TPA: hypothetical protein VFG47_04895, partial [Geminicoccaceae bacterium]|nr:hypothetical protein [Geminicoccaceae bacterium]